MSDSDETKSEILRILGGFWMCLRSYDLRQRGFSFDEIGKILSRNPSTVRSYCRKADRELEHLDSIHFFLTARTRNRLNKIGIDTTSAVGAVEATEVACNYYAGVRTHNIGRTTAQEILNAVDDLYESRRNRRQTFGV